MCTQNIYDALAAPLTHLSARATEPQRQNTFAEVMLLTDGDGAGGKVSKEQVRALITTTSSSNNNNSSSSSKSTYMHQHTHTYYVCMYHNNTRNIHNNRQ